MPTAPMIDERDFKPKTIEQAEQLYEALVTAGHSHGVARGVVSWVMFRPERRADDPATNKLRADYRRALLRLGSPPWGGPNGGKGV